MLLVEARDWKENGFSAYAYHVPFAELPELSLGDAIEKNPIAGDSGHTRTAGYVFRLKYDYANTYLAEFSGRYDGSYNFSGNVSNKRWGFFPSLSLGWRITNEKFMEQSKSWLDDLKIRLSVGLLGNDGVPPYSFLSTYDFGTNWISNGTAYRSLYSTAIPNLELTWSKTRSQNIGFDATLWHGL